MGHAVGQSDTRFVGADRVDTDAKKVDLEVVIDKLSPGFFGTYLPYNVCIRVVVDKHIIEPVPGLGVETDFEIAEIVNKAPWFKHVEGKAKADRGGHTAPCFMVRRGDFIIDIETEAGEEKAETDGPQHNTPQIYTAGPHGGYLRICRKAAKDQQTAD